PEDLALLDGEGDIVDRSDVTVVLVQVLHLDHGSHEHVLPRLFLSSPTGSPARRTRGRGRIAPLAAGSGPGWNHPHPLPLRGRARAGAARAGLVWVAPGHRAGRGAENCVTRAPTGRRPPSSFAPRSSVQDGAAPLRRAHDRSTRPSRTGRTAGHCSSDGK